MLIVTPSAASVLLALPYSTRDDRDLVSDSYADADADAAARTMQESTGNGEGYSEHDMAKRESIHGKYAHAAGMYQ